MAQRGLGSPDLTFSSLHQGSAICQHHSAKKTSQTSAPQQADRAAGASAGLPLLLSFPFRRHPPTHTHTSSWVLGSSWAIRLLCVPGHAVSPL